MPENPHDATTEALGWYGIFALGVVLIQNPVVLALNSFCMGWAAALFLRLWWAERPWRS